MREELPAMTTMSSYVEFSLIEKLHARITEVSPANPGETLNDAVERLISERDELRAQVAELRGSITILRAENHMITQQLYRA